MEAWEVLERAADKIERDGWGQASASSDTRPNGPGCALNALAAVSEVPDIYYNKGAVAWEAAVSAMARALGSEDDTRRSIWHWNDAAGRTKDEVTSVMRAVAASLKAARTEAARQHAPESTVAEVATGDAGALEYVS